MMRKKSFTTIALVLIFWLPKLSLAEEKAALRAFDVSDLIGNPKGVIEIPTLGIEPKMPRTVVSIDPDGIDAMTTQEFLWQHFDPDLASRIEQLSELTSLNGKMWLRVMAPKKIQDLVDAALNDSRNKLNKGNQSIVLRAKLFLMEPRLRQENYAFPQLDWIVDNAAVQPIAMLNNFEERRRVVLLLSGKEQPLAGQIESFDIAALSLVPGQRSFSSTMHQIEYRPISFPPNDGAADVALLNVGDIVSVRACPSYDNRFIHLQVEHQRCSLHELRHINLGVAGVRDEPVLWFGQEHIDRRIPDGAALIIATKVYQDSDRPRAGFMLINVDIVEFE